LGRFPYYFWVARARDSIDFVRSAKQDIEDATNRKALLLAAVGLWKDRTELPDTQTYVRSLRKGTRLQRISQ
jgi:hypothetical protein